VIKRYSGRKYNALTLVEKSRPGGDGIGAIWWAVCDCGNRVEVVARRVVAGDRKSCGNCGKGLGNKQIERYGIPRGMRAHLLRIIKQNPKQPVNTANYVSLQGKRCIICNTQAGVLPEWADDRIQFVPLCRRCSAARMGGKLAELLEWVLVVARRVQERLGE
jgi:hypothetical protein